MPACSEDQLTQNLRETNTRLRFWLEGLAPEDAHRARPTPQVISGLLSELLRIGECLRGGPPAQPDTQLQAELEEYRGNIQRLRDRMPAIHRHLLEERARMESERTRIEAAMEWARGSLRTF